MALSSAHEGYEYQDLLTAYFILNEIMQERDADFFIDRKEYEGDNIDDLVIINSDKKFKKQIKYSNPDHNHVLSKADLSTDAKYSLSLDSLYYTWLNNISVESTDFRICLSWQEPVDELIDILVPTNGCGTFSNHLTKVFKINGEKLWPKNSLPLANWKRFRAKSKDIDRNSFLQFCDNLLIETLMPKISLNLAMPGDLEKIVIGQAKDLGIGIFPNENMQPESFILALLAIIKRSRSKNLSLSISGVFHELNIVTDYGSIEQSFPVIESENIKRISAVEEFLYEISFDQKILLTGEPGSGKSWFMENLMNHLSANNLHVVRHFCYTDLNDSLQKERIKLNVFYGNLIADIIVHFPHLKKVKKQKFASNLNELNHLLQHIKEPTFIIIDGLDHIERIATFRNFSSISRKDRAIIENLDKLQAGSLVKIIVTSQVIPDLEDITGFSKKSLPKWTEDDIKMLLKKNRIRNKILKKGYNTVNFLNQKSKGNPLYLKYLIDEIKLLPIVTLKSIAKLPEYSFNLSEYYSYLISHLKLREDVPQILSGVSFSLTKLELKEITSSGDFVDESLEILSPVLKINLSQSGYSIYHESFRRYILDHLKLKAISIDKKIFKPILEWFETKDFFIYRKSYRYYLQYLSEGECFDLVLSKLNKDFVTSSIIYGHSWKLIEKNYKFFVNAACCTKNFPAIVLLNEIDKIISSCPESFQELYTIYLKTIGHINGFQYLSDYLLFDGLPAVDYLDGLKACYICDENNIAAPWLIYLEYFKDSKNVDEDNFKYLIRGLLVTKDEKRLDRISKNILNHPEIFTEIFTQELKIYSSTDFIHNLCEKYKNVASLLKSENSSIETYNPKKVMKLVDEILLMNNIHHEEEKTIKIFFKAVKNQIENKNLISKIIQSFTGFNWFYNWLIYYIKIINLSISTEVEYLDIKEAFTYLTKTTEPFEGEPRTCDLYTLHSFIYESYKAGLKLMNPEFAWNEILDILVTVTNNTTTSIQGEMTGPLTTDKLFQLLTEFINEKNSTVIIEELEKQITEKSTYHFHTNVAQYKLQLASLYAVHQNKEIASENLKEGIELILGYTLHKDLTLLDVIEGIEYYALTNHTKALEDLKKVRMLTYSAVLHTNGKETRHFPIMWFERFLKIDSHRASIYLLNQLKDNRYHWWQESSLVKLLCHVNGSVNPEIEAYIALTFPLEDSEDFLDYCLNLYEYLKDSSPSLASKLLDRITQGMKPVRDRKRSNDLIKKFNKIGNDLVLEVIPEINENEAEKEFLPWYADIIERQQFSMMSEDEIVSYFYDNNIETKDLNSIGYFFDTVENLSENIKELIKQIVFKNNRTFNTKVDLDILFNTGDDLECFYWVCRFVSDSAGWYQKFVNTEAFLKATQISRENAFSYLFELLPNYLDIGFNILFSSNLIKLLVSLDYDAEIIEKCWQNLVDITDYRLPIQENFDWDEIFKIEMNSEEIFLSLLLSRFKAETSDRYKITIMALENLTQEKSEDLIKPFKWFLDLRSNFTNVATLIILQYIFRQSAKDQKYALNFKETLLKIYPSKYYTIDYIISELYNLKIDDVDNADKTVYTAVNRNIYNFIYPRNYKFRIYEMHNISIKNSFNKYMATFHGKYHEYFELYGNRVYEKSVRHIYPSEYMFEIFNTDCYAEFRIWGLWEESEAFRQAVFIDTASISAHANSGISRPSDLLKPSEMVEKDTILEEFDGNWIRLGHVECELKKTETFKTTPFRSFGAINFTDHSDLENPYSDYSLYPLHIWGNYEVHIELDPKIICIIMQEEPLEYFNLIWVNPKIIKLLNLKTVKNSEGLYAVNDTGEKVLRMRTWSGEYIGEGRYQSSLFDEIPTTEGTDLIIRDDYFQKLCGLFTNKPQYQVEKFRSSH